MEPSAEAGPEVNPLSDSRGPVSGNVDPIAYVPGYPLDPAAALAQFVRDLANNAVSEQQLLHQLAEAAAAFTQAEGSGVLELDGNRYRAVATTGHIQPFHGHQVDLQPGPSLFREVIASAQPVYTNDANDARIDPRFRAPLRIEHVAVVPIVIDNTVSGLLLCINAARGGFTASDISLLSQLADHSALVVRTHRLVRHAELAAADARQRAADAARAARHNAVLARTARLFADAITRESVYNSVIEVLQSEVHAAGFAIYDADSRLRTVRLEYQWGAGTVNATRVATVFHQSVLGRSLSSRQAIFLSDIRRESQHSAPLTDELLDDGVGAVALLPLLLDGEPRGLLTIRYLGTHEFDVDEQQLLQDLGTQIAIAYRNLRHLAELERRAERLGAMADAQQQLTHVTDADSLPGAIADAVNRVIPCAHCDVLAMTPEGLERVILTEHGVVVSHARATATELAIAQHTLKTGVSRLVVHADESPHWARGASELCAVVRYGSRNSGVLRLLAPTPDAFDLQDLDLLTILGRQAGAAVETTRLFTLQDYQRQRAEGAAELARVALHAVSLGNAASEVIAALDRLVPSIGKAIAVVRNRDGLLEYVATNGTLDILRGRRSKSTLASAALTPDGRSRIVENLRSVSASFDVEAMLPDEWAYLVPLAARDRTLGLLVVSAPRSVPLPRRDRVTLERLSTSLAVALDALLLDEEERMGREREHLLATAFTTIDHPIFILDRVGMRYANPAAAREYGWSQMELMEMQFEQLVERTIEPGTRPLGDAQAGSRVSLIEHVHRRADGSEFPAVVTTSPLMSQDGEVLGQVVSVRNVSTERRVEEQLRHTEKMVALGELVAGVAHEINNPLTGISAFAQMLLEEPLQGDQRESVQLIKQESDRAKAVIRDLLIFARRTEAKIGPVDVNDMIEQTLRLRAYPLRLAGVRVVLDLDPTIPNVSGDIQKLQQVLINLIGNAEHAMSESPTRVLTVRTTLSDQGVLVAVSDTGRGMSPEVSRRIFEPFFTTKPAGLGTGLGLSVSYGIVQAHGGEIAVVSEPGAGTTVSVTLPRTARIAPLAGGLADHVIADSFSDHPLSA